MVPGEAVFRDGEHVTRLDIGCSAFQGRDTAMPTDLYTRVVLTVIAIALTVIATLQIRDTVAPDAFAGPAKPGVQRVVVCDESGDFCARVDETSRLFVK